MTLQYHNSCGNKLMRLNALGDPKNLKWTGRLWQFHALAKYQLVDKL